MTAFLSFMAGEALAAGCSASPSCPYEEVSVLGADPPAGGGVFRFPQAITFTPGGSHVFVADQYSAIVQKFDRQGRWVSQLGWYADNKQLGRLGVIGGLAADRNNHLYVLDSQNDRVQVYRSDTGAWIGAWGSTGSTQGRFNLGANTGAGGIALHQAAPGDPPIAFVADQHNHRIQRFTLDQHSSADPSGPVLPSGARSAAESNYVPAPVVDRAWGSFGNCTVGGCGSAGARFLLDHPEGVAVNPRSDTSGEHYVHVADTGNQRVITFTLNGTYVREVGSSGSGTAQFNSPIDVGADSRDELFVADSNNHRVQKFNAFNLSFLGEWGSFGRSSGNLASPRALASPPDDPLGGTYVADSANNRIQGFDPNGGVTATWGIAGRGPGYVTRPAGLAVDRVGDVYVADTWAHRIEKLSSAGAYLGQWGYISPSSGYAARRNGAGEFAFPRGAAYDPAGGNVWVADSGNNRVQELTTEGSWVATFGGPNPGSLEGQFSDPGGIATTSSGDVYVADTGNNRVQKREPTGVWSRVVVGRSLDQPAAVAIDRSGTLYVADRNRVLRSAGGGATEITPPSGSFDRPSGLWASASHLYVSDTGNNRVLRMSLATGEWQSFGGEGYELGSFVFPTGLTTNPGASSLYVADQYNNRIQKFVFPRATTPRTVTSSSAAPRAPARTRVRDRVAPKLRLRARLRQRVLRSGGVVISLNCSERCFVTASGRVSVRRPRKVFRLRRVRGTLTAGKRVKMKLRISKKTRRSLARALARGTLLVAVITVRGRDTTGNVASERRRVRLRA